MWSITRNYISKIVLSCLSKNEFDKIGYLGKKKTAIRLFNGGPTQVQEKAKHTSTFCSQLYYSDTSSFSLSTLLQNFLLWSKFVNKKWKLWIRFIFQTWILISNSKNRFMEANFRMKLNFNFRKKTDWCIEKLFNTKLKPKNFKNTPPPFKSGCGSWVSGWQYWKRLQSEFRSSS